MDTRNRPASLQSKNACLEKDGASRSAPAAFRNSSHFSETPVQRQPFQRARERVWTNDLSSFLQGKKRIYKEATKGIKEAAEKAAKNLA